MGSILLNKRPIRRNSALCVLRMREDNAHAKPKRAPKGPFISVEKLR